MTGEDRERKTHARSRRAKAKREVKGDLWRAIEAFREETDLSDLDVDEIFKDVRSPPVEPSKTTWG